MQDDEAGDTDAMEATGMSWKDFLSEINIGEHLKGLGFPCTKQDLIEHAQEFGAPDQVIELLDRLPDQEYESVAQVLEIGVKSML
jgi:hypothetical protein